MIDMAGMPPRLTPGPLPSLGERIGTALRRGQSLELYLASKGEKVYSSKEEALSRLLQPPNSFIASEDTAVVLLERGLARTSGGGWQFTRDPRLQIPAMDLLSLTDQLDAAEQISCPHLLIEAEEGAKFDPEIFQQILQVYQESPRFEHQLVEGRHHVHIDQPQLVANIINSFLASILYSNVTTAKL